MAKKRTNSCVKGKTGELELVHYLKSLGFTDARRTQQHNGAEGKSDVVCELSLPRLHIECKFGYSIQSFDLGLALWEEAIQQAHSESGELNWCVMWKPKRLRQWRMSYQESSGFIVTVASDLAIEAVLNSLGSGV